MFLLYSTYNYTGKVTLTDACLITYGARPDKPVNENIRESLSTKSPV